MRRSIKKKLVMAFLVVLLVPMFTALSLTEIGMFILRGRSEDLLVSQTLHSSQVFVDGQANAVEKQMSGLLDSVCQAADYATYVYENQERFVPQFNPLPEQCDLSSTEFQFHWLPFSKDLGREEKVIQEAQLLTALEPQFKSLRENSPMIVSLYVATSTGVNIGYDANVASKTGVGAYNPQENMAQWYRMGILRPDEVYISDIYEDVFGRGTMVTIAKSFSVNGQVYGVVGADLNIEGIKEEILNINVGNQAEMMLFTGSGGVICAQSGKEDFKQLMGDNAEAALTGIVSSTSGITESVYNGDEVRLIHGTVATTGWRLVQRLSLEEIAAPARESNETILTINLLLVGSYLVLTLVMMLMVNRLSQRTAQPIVTLTHEVGRIGDGHLEYTSNITTGDEIEQLSHSFEEMTISLQGYIENLTAVTAEKERIGAELDVAKHIQASMLPCIFPAFPERPELDIYATMTPAKEVGGDFYDFFLVDDDHLAMVMADVSGKGVPAALFMVIAKTLIKNVTQTGLNPSAVLAKVNNQLCENNEADMFVTVWLGILEISTGRMICANAGHEYPVIKRAGGRYEVIHDQHDLALGAMEGMPYCEYELHIDAGDKLFLYTDGVPEATNGAFELYDMDRMVEALNRNKEVPNDQLLQNLKEDIDAFVGDAPQFDDITMLCLELKTKADGEKTLLVKPSLESLAEVAQFVEQALLDGGVNEMDLMQMNIAVDEVFANIIHYSGASDAVVRCRVENGTVTLSFADNGTPYDPTLKEDPDITLSAEEREIGGLGIYMVKKFMTRMEYVYRDGMNILTLTKQPEVQPDELPKDV